VSRLLLAPHAATVHARARRTSHHAMARRGAQARHLKRTRHPYPLPGSAWQPAVFKFTNPASAHPLLEARCHLEKLKQAVYRFRELHTDDPAACPLKH